LVPVVGGRDVGVVDAPVHADSAREVIDFAEAELAVQVEEDDAVLNRQVRMSPQIPQIQQVLIVQQKQRVPDETKEGSTNTAISHQSPTTT